MAGAEGGDSGVPVWRPDVLTEEEERMQICVESGGGGSGDNAG